MNVITLKLATWRNTARNRARTVIGCTCTLSTVGSREKKNTLTITPILMIITAQIMQFIWHFRFVAHVTVYRTFVLHTLISPLFRKAAATQLPLFPACRLRRPRFFRLFDFSVYFFIYQIRIKLIHNLFIL